MGQSLLHRRACITRKAPLLQSGMGITNWGKSYFKVGQVIYYKVGQSLLSSEASVIKWGSFITSGAGTKKRPVHLCDNRTNGVWEWSFNGVLFDAMPFTWLKPY